MYVLEVAGFGLVGNRGKPVLALLVHGDARHSGHEEGSKREPGDGLEAVPMCTGRVPASE